MGKNNQISDSHKAYSLYQKTIVELRETTEDDHFTHAVKTVANQLQVSQTEAKEAIYQGYADRHDLSYEESKALFKSLRNTPGSAGFEDYYKENRSGVEKLKESYTGSDEKTYDSWLSDRLVEEVAKLREKFDNLDHAIAID